jgi:transposase, IS5 family
MRPKKHETTGSGDLFRARLEQIINMKHELVLLAGKIEWQWIDSEIAPLYSDKGRPGIETRFVIGLLLLKHIYGLSDEGVCERWVHDPYFHAHATHSAGPHHPRYPAQDCGQGRA